MTKKLYRSQAQKMIGGVCAGLAEYFDLDVNIMRLLFIALTLLTAILPMLIFYIIAWLIVPVEEEVKKKKTG
ncbi:MAG: PspC domain-containing protein [Candidatus Aminicenantes bacterium]|jgi:phage shock protein C